eukprot:CAMPEP_0117431522 /NCGR_PEP_ID=MMETSP0758-20121206/11048_1 /TAXON_ID=63605 /ORGANISM="Percolomonas cosmopolitus, Strain AE-1 (ATCC 50343)" /LENGTH=270 /DNA_ID=CAMNT_0005220599 /DNA_START=233 /DNA_END=1045 /DNA_ORIENTATION=+
MAEATLYCKQKYALLPQLNKEKDSIPVCISGIPFFEEIFNEIGEGKIEFLKWNYEEGDVIEMKGKEKEEVAKIKGPIHLILQAERLGLNLLTRCSGISTTCHQMVSYAKEKGYKGELAGTRKTTPGFRLVEKYGLIVGGFSPHRYDVSSMVMLKDNHIDGCNGSITEAVKRTRSLCGFATQIEVECRSITDAMEAAKAGANIVMLDNFQPDSFKKAAEEIKKTYPNIIVEGSGGIRPDMYEQYFNDHVDVLSTSYTIQGHDCIDFSLKLN